MRKHKKSLLNIQSTYSRHHCTRIQGSVESRRGTIVIVPGAAESIADFIILCSREHGDGVSNLKLQKLLYYSQAWHLALHGTPLFGDKIQAWAHGPAVPSVWRKFREFTWKPITPPLRKPVLATRAEKLVLEVIQAYSHLSAYQLEALTHSEQPWISARAGIPLDQPCRNEISLSDMRDFYRQRLNEQK